MSLAVLFTQHASPSMMAAGFAIMLVLSLVAAEEAEMRRRPGAPADDRDHDIADRAYRPGSTVASAAA